MDKISEFKEAMSERGLDPGEILTDGIIHRFPTWGDQSGEASGTGTKIIPDWTVTTGATDRYQRLTPGLKMVKSGDLNVTARQRLCTFRLLTIQTLSPEKIKSRAL